MELAAQGHWEGVATSPSPVQPPQTGKCAKSPPAPWLLPWGRQNVVPLPQAPRGRIWARWCRGVPRGSGCPPPPHPSPSLHNSERDKAEVLKVLSAAIYTASGKVWQALSWFPEMKMQTSLLAAHSQNLPPPGPRIEQCCPFTPKPALKSRPQSSKSRPQLQPTGSQGAASHPRVLPAALVAPQGRHQQDRALSESSTAPRLTWLMEMGVCTTTPPMISVL